MRVFSKILFTIGIVFGIFGIREYIRDDAYRKASIVVKATVISADVKPNPFKAVGSIHLLLNYMHDGVAEMLTYNYTEFYSTNNPLPSFEAIKLLSYYVRYIPKEKKSDSIPNWVIVSRNEKFDAMYGRTWFGHMATCILLGFIIKLFSSRRRKNETNYPTNLYE